MSRLVSNTQPVFPSRGRGYLYLRREELDAESWPPENKETHLHTGLARPEMCGTKGENYTLSVRVGFPQLEKRAAGVHSAVCAAYSSVNVWITTHDTTAMNTTC